MTCYDQSWLRVDHVPGFRSPADALVWASRVYLASVRIGKEPSPLVDQMLVTVFSVAVRDAFKRLMHAMVATSLGELELKSPTDYQLARHERQLLASIEHLDASLEGHNKRSLDLEWTSSERSAALLTIHVAFDQFVGDQHPEAEPWPPESSNLGSLGVQRNDQPGRRQLH